MLFKLDLDLYSFCQVHTINPTTTADCQGNVLYD